MKLTWDNIGERFYELGVDHGVLYPQVEGAYPKGFPWNGLTAVNENPSGAELTPLHADNIKYANIRSAEDFVFTIEAFTYPDEWEPCDGSAQPVPGVSIGQQDRQPFGMSYRTKFGNDTEGQDYGYKLHLVWGAHSNPSDRGYQTVNDSPDAVTLSWECSTDPVPVEGYKPFAHMEINSTKVDPAALAALEEALYGTAGTDAYLPMPDEVLEILQAN